VVLWGSAVYTAYGVLKQRARQLTQLGVGALACAALVCHARTYANGETHQHFQVVEWVERNVSDETWVGGIQTGTLGFFHDHTINLDGKVNAEALAARKLDRIGEYVAATPIAYLVDWTGILSWTERDAIASRFETLLVSYETNLVVLRRRDFRERPHDVRAER